MVHYDRFYRMEKGYMGALREIIDEHIQFKSQIFKLAKSDLHKTYSGAALGWSWAVVQPMVTIFVFWFGFTVGLRTGKPIEGYPYFLWLVAGFLPWFYMSDCLTGGANCIRKYKYLVTKMKFPISVIPTYFNLSHLFVHFVLLGITVLVFALFGYMPDIYMLQIPLYMLMMFVFFIIWSLFSGLLSCISKDFLNLVKAGARAIFWLSGIIFNVDTIHIPWIKVLLKFNPITVVASGYRNTFIYKKWFFETPIDMYCYLITLSVFILLALWAFKKLRKEIPDVL